MPKLLGFSQMADKATKNWLLYDAADDSIIGEYSPKGFDTTVSLLMPEGEAKEIALVGPDEFLVIDGGARGTRVRSFFKEPERGLRPDPVRQRAWDGADREHSQAQDRFERARERTPYLK